MTPQLQIALGVVAALTLVGVVVSFFRKGALYKGYEELATEAPKIAGAIKGQIFRDGDDLVIAGNYKQYPAQVRFSYSETTPGLNIRMQAPVSFTFSVVPKGERATEGRVLVRTGDDMFDAKFAARTDHPTQAKMLVGSKQMRTQMEKLCCSSKTFLTLTRGAIELSELTIPSPYAGRHVQDHLDSMGILAKAVDDIPGAETIKIEPYVYAEKSTPIFKIALAVGAICTLIAIFVLEPTAAQPDLTGVNGDAATHTGVAAADAAQIPGINGFHAATAEDFDPNVASWVRSGGQEPAGRAELKLDPADDHPDVAYWIRNADGVNRIVVLLAGTKFLDSAYGEVLGIARVPHDSLQGVKWRIPPLRPPAGDGLVIVTRHNDAVNSTVLYLAGGRLESGNPENYETLSLQ